MSTSPVSTGTTSRPRRWAKQFGWLVLIWAASVLALGIVASAFRLAMSAVGLTP